MTDQDPHGGHLDPVSLARFIDGGASPDQQALWEAHLAECGDCRAELIESGRILATSPRHPRWTRLVPIAAAAAVLLVIWTGTLHRPRTEPVTRDATLTVTMPLPVAPLGNVSRFDTLRWRAVPEILRYRVTLFTGDGQVAWQTTTADTFAVPGDALRIVAVSPYYWQVKAETTYGRWVESEVVGFTLVPR
jgi:hypothetical protein